MKGATGSLLLKQLGNSYAFFDLHLQLVDLINPTCVAAAAALISNFGLNAPAFIQSILKMF